MREMQEMQKDACNKLGKVISANIKFIRGFLSRGTTADSKNGCCRAIGVEWLVNVRLTGVWVDGCRLYGLEYAFHARADGDGDGGGNDLDGSCGAVRFSFFGFCFSFWGG